ncbi:MAG: dTDP-glucose 4,6-dehydratase [Planctomycetota bacterium]|jgi:dTDP-glucose 4,6-dehydratase
MSKILVTGGAGFIGSNFVRMMVRDTTHDIVNVDALTYAGNLENLVDLEGNKRHLFVRADIADTAAMTKVFGDHRPDVVVHFAAESHVDRSVLDATAFVRTNVAGTQVLLDQSRAHKVQRFVHVSTDEVYGSLGPWGYFNEDTPIQPNSPYSSSKAGSDLLVRAAVHTHHMDCVITRCSNNYGPYQFPEKLIPLIIANAMEGKKLPVYGDGRNVRDWIFVEDHCTGVRAAMERGKAGEVYNFGGNAERENIEVIRQILKLVGRGEDLITYVKDRPGHDRRYAMDVSKAKATLGWTPSFTFEDGIRQTVDWYVRNGAWLQRVRSGDYQRYYETQYGKR